MIFTPQHFSTYSLDNSFIGGNIRCILAAAINAADPEAAIRNHVERKGKYVIVDQHTYCLDDYHRVFIFAVGKASVLMTNAIYQLVNDRLAAGIVITKEGHLNPHTASSWKNIYIHEACHPIPDGRNLQAASHVLKLAKEITKDDLVIVLLSGGGSSLLTQPATGLTLDNIRDTTNLLLACGGTINEINSVRKHIDIFKGGGLAKLLYPATIMTMILSDVVGDIIDVIASGPTTFDTSTYSDALSVLQKYQILDQIPQAISAHIKMGMAGSNTETVKPGDPILKAVKNIIVGNNAQASKIAASEAIKLGFRTKILTNALQGEASNVGAQILRQGRDIINTSFDWIQPVCLIAGGETTVTCSGHGLGGRNQELVLGAVDDLAVTNEMILVSLATDGGDGPTDAAGAVATNKTYSRGLNLDMKPREYLDQNDSYHYFERLGDLIKTGPTLTNVSDLIFIFSYRPTPA